MTAGLLTMKEVAVRLRAAPATLYRLCEEGKLCHVRVTTHSIRIAAADLLDFIAKVSRATRIQNS